MTNTKDILNFVHLINSYLFMAGNFLLVIISAIMSSNTVEIFLLLVGLLSSILF